MAIPQPDPVTLEFVYDEEVFLSPPAKELQCVICFLVARDPYMITCCGATICEVCPNNCN